MGTVAMEFDITLDRLAEQAIHASVEQLTAEDRLTIALRDALQNGADMDDISGITGIPVIEIRRRLNRNLNVLSEDAFLAVA